LTNGWNKHFSRRYQGALQIKSGDNEQGNTAVAAIMVLVVK
jgi:hypothetical protein